MRRFVPSGIDKIRSKAKLFHRCIDLMQDDGIGAIRPGYKLTDAQRDLAGTLGFSNWAELKAVVTAASFGRLAERAARCEDR